MKIKVGMHSNELEIFDDEGNKLNLIVAELDIQLRPDQATRVQMVVYVDEVEAKVGADYLTTVRKKFRAA